MTCSMMMCLKANGIDCTEDDVNRVMGARPMKGAAWEEALACAQHYGMRATLTVPATLRQLKDWTDRGIPVMIAWNPEGRDWSHASVVFDVEEQRTLQGNSSFVVHVADPNIPNPDQTVRVVTEDEFYRKWFEKWPNYLVRRPAMAVEREITVDGRQVMAVSQEDADPVPGTKLFVTRKPSRGPFRGTKPQYKILNQYGGVVGGEPDRERAFEKAKQMKRAKILQRILIPTKAPRDPNARARAGKPGGGAGAHHTRDRDVEQGRSRKPKHKKDWRSVQGAVEPPSDVDLKNIAKEFHKWCNSRLSIPLDGLAIHDNPRRREVEIVGLHTHDNARYLNWGSKEDRKLKVFQNRIGKKYGLVDAWGGLGTPDLRWVLSFSLASQNNPTFRVATVRQAGYKGNPDGKDIYPNEIGHGYGEPLAGGTDVMRRLQNQLIHEQGDVVPQRPESSRLASGMNVRNKPLKGIFRVSPKEKARAVDIGSGVTMTFVARPQDNGGILVAGVDVKTGKVILNGLLYAYVDSKRDISNTIRLLSRDIEKFTGYGSQMTDRSRMRPGAKGTHMATRVAARYIRRFQ